MPTQGLATVKTGDKYINTEGRLIIPKLKIEQNHFGIANMYALTRDHKKEQLDFITLFKESISIYENENILIGGGGGGFNFYLDKTLDKQEGMSEKHYNPEYRKEINSLPESMNLLDIWRIFNPTLRHYTWHSRGTPTRLD